MSNRMTSGGERDTGAMSIEEIVAEDEALQEQVGQIYARKDQLGQAIAARLGSNGAKKLQDGRWVVNANNFTDGDGNPRPMAFKSTAVRYFEPKVVKSKPKYARDVDSEEEPPAGNGEQA